MKIWILNHYATDTFFDHGGRHYEFAKYLIRAGYDVHIFCASTVHNTNENLIKDGILYCEDTCDGIPYVFVKTRDYAGNGKQRILNMLDYYIHVQKTANHFDRPDVIIGSSVHPLACVAAIRLAKKYSCRNIVEIRDLWPESIVAYNLKKKNSPVIRFLYRLEKWLYTKANAIVFTMEGGHDYIIKKGWDSDHGGPVDMNKVFHINNGVDLEVFDLNKESYNYNDDDIDDDEHFKVVYTGSVRSVNGVEQLLDTAKRLKSSGRDNIRLLIFGDGDRRMELEQKAASRGLDNILFKGRVAKESIPSILSKSDLCLLHWKATPITEFGMSMNKFFEYIAAGKPIISCVKPKYDIVSSLACGISENITDSSRYADLIYSFSVMSEEQYKKFCEQAKLVCVQYDYKTLTKRMIDIINCI